MAQTEYLAGMLRVLILSELSRGEGYGYGIARALGEAGGEGLEVRPESLYPVLHRMEQDNLLSARWDTAENGRPRKLYRLTPKGKKHWEKLRPQFIRHTQAALKAVGVPALPGKLTPETAR